MELDRYITGTGLDFLREPLNDSGWNKSTSEFNKTQQGINISHILHRKR